MKSVIGLALAALLGLSSVAAAPVDGRRVVVEKRGDGVVWKTVVNEVIQTIDVTTTIWVTPGQAYPTPVAQAAAPASSSSCQSSTTAAAPKPVVPVPVAKPQPEAQNTPSSAAPIVAPTPSVTPYVAAAPKPDPPAPASSSPPAPAPTTSTAPAPAPATNSNPPIDGPSLAEGFSNPLPGADESYTCTSGSPCGTPNDATAKASFYSMTDPTTGAHGLGSCGDFHDATSEDFVAINQHIMGSLSSGIPMNPLCGLTVTVKNTNTGKTAQGKVVDTCPGCKSTWGIDLSNHLFDQLAAEGDGLFPVDWWFEAA